ncbi:hypothetical protein IAT40_000362 [Kwoniella sp. CBS 6097]
MLAGLGLFVASVAGFSWLSGLTSSVSHKRENALETRIDWTQVSNSTTFFFEHITNTIYGKAAAVNYTELPDTAKQFFENQTDIVKDAFVKIEWENLPQVAKDYILTVPVMEALGFARLGPVARSAAAAAQSAMKNVPARSWFSIFQSARMGGYGRPIVNGAVRAGAGFWGGLSWVWGRSGQTKAASMSPASPARLVADAKAGERFQ